MQKIRNSDLWRMNYLNDRYMEYLPKEELFQRCLNVLYNFITINQDGKISLRLPDERSKFWSPIITEIQTELSLKGSQFPPPEIAQDLGKLISFPNIETVISKMKTITFPRAPYFVKYGDKEHLAKMYRNGTILIKPASAYTDSSLNKAQRDDELRRELALHPNRVRIIQDEQKTPLKPIGNIRLCLKSSSDYYLYCMAKEADVRLFRDFKSNACLVVRNPERFVSDVVESVRRILTLKGHGFGVPILYIDPLNPPPGPLNVFGTKLFDFWYQLEYRIVFIPFKPVEKLEPVEIEIGSMSEYSDLIIIQD